MIVSIIVAMDKNGVIGKNLKGMPWYLPADLKHFKEITTGKPVIMGRVTYDTIGKPLPNRQNIVLTRDPAFSAQNVEVVRSINEAVHKAKQAEEIMVIGGANIYKQFLPLANRMYVTRIHAEFEGDTYFTKVNWDEWREIARESHEPDGKNPYPYTFLTYERVNLSNVAS